MSATRFTIQLNNSTKSYRNGFKDSAVVGPLMFQWGQDNSVSDSAQYFNFQRSFASKCHLLLTTASNPNTRSAMPVIARETTRFGVDRDAAIDGPYRFYWVAVGDAPGTSGPDVGTHDVDSRTTVFWGNGVSTSDGAQDFTTPRALGAGPVALLTTVTLANVRSALPASQFDAAGRTLTIDRHADVDGAVGFNYLGIGSASTITSPSTATSAVVRLGDFKLQWGRATSTSDYEQLFDFPESFKDMNFAVVTTLAASGFKQGLSLTRPINARSFVVDRDSDIDGSRAFYWLAVGR